MNRSVVVIGGGPAGLMASETVSQQGFEVHLYDSMPSLGRKFLLAGRGGLNLTHSESFEPFAARYGSQRSRLEPMLREFGADEVRAWARRLGVETFVGTSGRVFPREMKASPLLRAWLKSLAAAGVSFHLRHQWQGWNADHSLRFETVTGQKNVSASALVLAMGGGSWARLGSNGRWVDWLRQTGVQVTNLRPANCGFDVAWSAYFRDRFEGQPLKSVRLSFEEFGQLGDFVISREGIQGSLVYAASARIRDALEMKGHAVVSLDLSPDRSLLWLRVQLSKPRGSRSLTNHLEKTVGLKGVKVGLLYEFVSKTDLAQVDRVAWFIKNLRVSVLRPRPLDEAISSAGGVCFDGLDEHLMIERVPGVFCAGEMLDWEAPTGGYLLTGCLATGRAAGRGVIRWLRERDQASPALSSSGALPAKLQAFD